MRVPVLQFFNRGRMLWEHHLTNGKDGGIIVNGERTDRHVHSASIPHMLTTSTVIQSDLLPQQGSSVQPDARIGLDIHMAMATIASWRGTTCGRAV